MLRAQRGCAARCFESAHADGIHAPLMRALLAAVGLAGLACPPRIAVRADGAIGVYVLLDPPEGSAPPI